MECRIVIGIAAIGTFITIVAAGVTPEQLDAMTSGIRSTCLKMTEADPDLVRTIREGKFPDGDQNLKCYTRCIMDITRVLKDGRIDLEKMAKQVALVYPEDIAANLVGNARKCDSETKEDDECEFMWSFLKCSYSADPSLFYFP